MFKQLTDQQRNIIERGDSKSPNMLKIKAQFQAYGTQYDFVRFYANEERTQIISIQDNVATFYGNEDDDFEEACNFLSMTTNEVLSEILIPLDEYCVGEGNIYVCKDIQNITLENVSHNIDDAYRVLSQVFSEDINEKNYPRWYTDVSHRVRHKVSRVYTYRNICSGTAYCNIDGQLLITKLATVESARGQGLATKMIHHIASHEKDVKRIVLLSQNKTSDRFYEKIGFTFYKNWYYYVREEKKD
jgi:GNAT superfamily N-acetyltransferase